MFCGQEDYINFPQRAFSTFSRLKNLDEFKSIYEFLLKVLYRTQDPVERARKTHHYVSSFTNEVLANPVAKKYVTCSRGCNACCHSQVSINADESKLLAKLILEDKVEVNLNKLYLQASVGNNSEKWFKLAYQDRGCVFLDSAGACSIYEDRPSVCRTNTVLSPPKNCETTDGKESAVRLLNTEKADMVIVASFEASGEGGALPSMLWRAMKNYEGPVNMPQNVELTSKKLQRKNYLKDLKKNLTKILDI